MLLQGSKIDKKKRKKETDRNWSIFFLVFLEKQKIDHNLDAVDIGGAGICLGQCWPNNYLLSKTGLLFLLLVTLTEYCYKD